MVQNTEIFTCTERLIVRGGDTLIYSRAKDPPLVAEKDRRPHSSGIVCMSHQRPPVLEVQTRSPTSIHDSVVHQIPLPHASANAPRGAFPVAEYACSKLLHRDDTFLNQ